MKNFIFCILLLITTANLMSWCYVIPSDIYLGGAFRVIYINTTNGIEIDSSAQQHQASFIVAINQINNKTDGVYDNLLPNTNIKFAIDWGSVNIGYNPSYNLYYDGSISSFYIHSEFPDVSMIVTTSPYETTSALEEIFIGWSVPVLINNSTRTEFSHGSNYPYNLRIPAAESYDAIVLASLIHNYYKWEKVSIFYTTDTYGQDCYFEFTKQGNLYGLEYLSVYPLSLLTTDFTAVVDNVRKVGSTIFVLLMDLSFAQTFLLSVYKLGMLKTGTQVLGTSTTATTALWENIPVDEVDEVMKGFIAVQYAPKLYFELPEGKEFVKIVQGLKPTITYDNGIEYCSTATDSAGSPLYYFDYGTQEYCVGYGNLDIVTAAILDPTTMMSYNSVIVYATAADYLIRNEIEVTGENIHEYLTNTSSFFLESSVGDISFSRGDPSNSQFGLGDRQTGQIYEILNYHSVYEGFTTVGVWSSNSTAFSCFDEIKLSSGSFNISNQCSIPIYRTYDSYTQPLDHPNDIHIELNYNLKYYYIVMSILIIVENIIFMSVMIYYRNTKTVKNSQLYVILTVNIGILFGAIRPIVGAFPIAIVNCRVQLFVEHLCFRLLFGTVMLKLWRIDKIVNATSFKRVKISEFQLLEIIIGHLILLLFVLSLIVGFDGVAIGKDITVVSNQSKITKICLFSNTLPSKVVLAFLYISEAGYLVLASYYLYKTRAVPPSVNETAILAPSLLGSIVTIVILAIVILALNLKASVTEIVINVGFTVILFFGSAYYYVSKMIQINVEFIKKNEKLGKSNPAVKPGQILPSMSAIISGKKEKVEEIKNEEDKDMLYMKNLLKSKHEYMEKTKILQQYMDICKILLMRLADEEDASSLNPSHLSHASHLTQARPLDSNFGNLGDPSITSNDQNVRITVMPEESGTHHDMP